MVRIGQFIKFGLIGVVNTLITLITYSFLLSCGINYIHSHLVGSGLGMLNSLYMNNRWVFQGGKVTCLVAFKFLFVNGISISMSTFLLYILANNFQMNLSVAQGVGIIVGMIANFFLNKKWTFHNKHEMLLNDRKGTVGC